MVKKNKKNRNKDKTPEPSKAKEEKPTTTQAKNTEQKVEEKKIYALQPQEENPPTNRVSKLSLESEKEKEKKQQTFQNHMKSRSVH